MTSDSPARLVLLVDDTVEAANAARALEEKGLRVIHVADTLAAESLLVSSLPDLIVLSLSDEGAPAFCDLIGAIPRGGGVPVVLITENEAAAPTALANILRGAHAFLARPVNHAELVSKVFALLDPGNHLPAAERAGPGPQEADHPRSDPPEIAPELAPTEAAPLLDEPSGIDGVGPREPTHVLNEPSGFSEGLSEKSFGLELSELLAEHPQIFTPASTTDKQREDRRPPSPAAAPQEGDAGAPRREERLASERGPEGGSPYVSPLAPTDDQESPSRAGPPGHGRTDPSSTPPPARPERTAILNAPERAPQGTDGPGPKDEPELSADFRRVIDEVAQRLFPEASPEEYQEDHFDELKTFVPIGDHGAAFYDEFDEFALDMMETFSRGQAGLTIAPFGGVPEQHDTMRETHQGEGDTNDHATQPRESVLSPAAPPAPAPDEPSAPPAAPSASPDPPAPLAPPMGSAAPPAPARATPAPEGQHRERGTPLPGRPPARPASKEGHPAAPRRALALVLGQVAVDRGRLEEHPFPTLFAACGANRFEGQLVLRGLAPQGNPVQNSVAERSILFRQGHPLMARSTEPQDRLLEMMFRQGMLTSGQYEKGRHLVETTSRRAGAILVELGTHTRRELFSLVRWHYREIVMACFDWRQGTFALEPPPSNAPERIVLEQSLDELLLEGLRRRYDGQELTGLLGGPATCLSRRSAAPLPRGLLEGEDHVVHSCDGTRTVDQVVAGSRLDPAQALAVLYGLVLLGQLASEAAPSPGVPTPFPPSGPHEPLGGRQQLQRRLQLCQEGDYFSLLGLTPNASAYEIRQAYEKMQHELTPEHLVALGTRESPEQLAALRYLLREAYDVLTNERLRQAYRASRFSRQK